MPQTARAAVSEGDGSFHLETIGLDPPGPGEVLVTLRASGVCHTDADSLRWGRPLILGHEGAGDVLAVGPGVTHIQPGDRVLLNWAIPCGRCFQCTRGKENICEDRGTIPDARYHRDPASSGPRPASSPEILSSLATDAAADLELQQAETASAQQTAPGRPTTARNTGAAGPGRFNASFSLGTMSTHALVPEAAVLPLPAGVPYPVAAIMGCGVMTGFGSAVNSAEVTPGSSVVVLGCGGVGLSTMLGAAYCGAVRIIAVDINPARLALAEQFGATETLLADRADTGLVAAAAEIHRRTAGRGADFAFECTAVPALGPAPLRMIRSDGTAVGVSGIEQVVPVDMALFEWDKLYINPLYGGCRPTRDFPLLIDLYLHGQLPLDAMVTRTYSLDHLDQAFADLHAGINAKGVIVF